LLSKNKILTRNNLEKREGRWCMSCLFCSNPESVKHLFFKCVVAKTTWEMVSRATWCRGRL
jgi:hypothetical protein